VRGDLGKQHLDRLELELAVLGEVPHLWQLPLVVGYLEVERPYPCR
jgi:hypothetical protein